MPKVKVEDEVSVETDKIDEDEVKDEVIDDEKDEQEVEDLEVQIVLTKEEKQEKLDKLVRNSVLASMGVGLVPIPLVDLTALSAIQMVMIKKLANHYDIQFSKGIGKSVIGTLIASLVPATLSSSIASIVKFIPIVGQTIGSLTLPIFAGSSTYALAKVFIQHFASGGTLLDLDPEKVKDYFEEQFKEGKNVVKNFK
jgi:uncharacterized protein (DUF697 family)